MKKYGFLYGAGLTIVLNTNTLGGLANDGNGTPDLQNFIKNAYDQAW